MRINLLELYPGIIAAMLLPLMSIFIKLSLHYYDAETLLFIRFLFSFLIFVLPISLKTQAFYFKTKMPLWHFARAITGSLAMGFMFLTLNKSSVSDTILMSNLAPVYLLIILVILKKFKFDLITSTFVLLSLMGIIYIHSPGSNINIGYVYGLLIGLFSAFSILILGKLKAEHINTTLSYYYAYSTLFFGLSFFLKKILENKFYFNLHANALFLLLLVSISSMAYQGSLVFAMKRLTPVVMAPLFFLSIGLSTFFDALIWHHHSGFSFYLAAAIIGFSSLIITIRLNGNQKRDAVTNQQVLE